jgi:hypothetical protein
MQEPLPKASKATRALAGNLITTTLSTVGKRFPENPRSRVEIEAYAEAMADMFCAYLRSRPSSPAPALCAAASASLASAMTREARS